VVAHQTAVLHREVILTESIQTFAYETKLLPVTVNASVIPCCVINTFLSGPHLRVWGAVRKNIISDRFSTKIAISAHI